MEAMRSTWTDSRLDDLSRRVDEGFRRVDVDLRGMRGETNSLRIEMNARFDSLQRTLIQFGGGLVASFVGLIVAFVLTAH
jgi:hypothetical protein